MRSAEHSATVGVVLAGGAASRMGEDKALLALGGETLLARALRTLREVVADLCIAGRRDDPLAVPDGAGRGPAAGILGAAAAFPGRPLLVLACDLPLLPAPLLSRLLEPPAADWVVPRWRGRFEPLCALYGPAALAALARQVEGGRFGLHELASSGLVVRTLDDAELARFGDPEEMFLNVNTPDDWERCRRLAG